MGDVLHIFEAYGVEIEYMIVDRESLAVRPVADEVLRSDTGEVVSDVEREKVHWSNELVLHVIELKTATPSSTLADLPKHFLESVLEVNGRLEASDAMLLPGGAHPFMDPLTETHLWPHEHNQVYELYNRVFDCRGHGWSNLQSTHINLPFANDEEFGRLHAGVRLLLPLLPALAASTPVLDGRPTGRRDSRLHAYRHNQESIPSLVGSVIPEQAFDQETYHDLIFEPALRDIRPYDTEGVLDRHFLNSRGAIARFDRGSIEIRIVDSQESPSADLGIVELIVAALKALADERWSGLADQKSWHERRLVPILDATIEEAEDADIRDSGYLQAFGLGVSERTAGQVWKAIADSVGDQLSLGAGRAIENILAHGTLSTRVLDALGTDPGRARIVDVYRALADCVAEDRSFRPDRDATPAG